MADELRAIVAAAGQEGRGSKAIVESYNCCTEGFDTKDLQEAKALLEQLTGSR